MNFQQVGAMPLNLHTEKWLRFLPALSTLKPSDFYTYFRSRTHAVVTCARYSHSGSLVKRRRWQTGYMHRLAVWNSDRAFVSITEVTLRRARLVLGWVTVREFVTRSHHLGNQPSRPTLAIPRWVGEISSDNGHDHWWGRMASLV